MRLQQAFSQTEFETVTDPDLMLYQGGFFSGADRGRFRRIRALSGDELTHWTDVFDDERVPEMLFRYRARNYPHALTQGEQARWQAFLETTYTNMNLAGKLADTRHMLQGEEAGNQALVELAAYLEEKLDGRRENTSKQN